MGRVTGNIRHKKLNRAQPWPKSNRKRETAEWGETELMWHIGKRGAQDRDTQKYKDGTDGGTEWKLKRDQLKDDLRVTKQRK